MLIQDISNDRNRTFKVSKTLNLFVTAFRFVVKSRSVFLAFQLVGVAAYFYVHKKSRGFHKKFTLRSKVSGGLVNIALEFKIKGGIIIKHDRPTRVYILQKFRQIIKPYFNRIVFIR